MTGGQVEGEGKEFGTLSQARSIEIESGLVTVISIIVAVDKFNMKVLKISDDVYDGNCYLLNDLSTNNRPEGQVSAQEYDVSNEVISRSMTVSPGDEVNLVPLYFMSQAR